MANSCNTAHLRSEATAAATDDAAVAAADAPGVRFADAPSDASVTPCARSGCRSAGTGLELEGFAAAAATAAASDALPAAIELRSTSGGELAVPPSGAAGSPSAVPSAAGGSERFVSRRCICAASIADRSAALWEPEPVTGDDAEAPPLTPGDVPGAAGCLRAGAEGTATDWLTAPCGRATGAEGNTGNALGAGCCGDPGGCCAGGCGWGRGEAGSGRGTLSSKRLGPRPELTSRVRFHVASHMLSPAAFCTGHPEHQP